MGTSTHRYGWVLAAVLLATPAGALDLKLSTTDLAVPGPRDADHAARAKAVAAVLAERNPGFSADLPGATDLCAWMAYWTEPNERSGRLTLSAKYHDIGVANFNAVQKAAARLAELKLPADVQAGLLTDLSTWLVRWRAPLDVDAWLARVADAAPGAGSVTPATPADLLKALAARYPAFAGLPPLVRKGVLDDLAAVNPALHADGYSTWPADGVRETRVHVAVPDGAGKVRAYVYDLRAGATLLLPADKVLAQWAARHAKDVLPVEAVVFQPRPATWWQLELPGAGPGKPPGDLRLYVVDDGGRVDAVAQALPGGRLIRLNVVEPPATTPPVKGAPASPEAKAAKDRDALEELGDGPASPSPAVGAAPAAAAAAKAERKPDPAEAAGTWQDGVKLEDEPLWPRTLTRTGDRLRGAVRVPVSDGRSTTTVVLTLDVDLSGPAASGTYTSQFADDRGRTRPGPSGEVKGQRWTADATANAVPATAAWPNNHGPNNDGSAGPSPAPLADPGQARLVWLSDATTPVGEWNDMRRNSPPGDPIIGGFASPVMAAGRTHLFYYRPAFGPVWEQRAAEHVPAGGWRMRYAILSDDVVTTYDAATGRTLWKTVFPAKGVSRGGMHKMGFMGTPAVADGRLFALGTTGRVYALDAATGAVLWESSLGIRARQMQAVLAQCVRAGEVYSSNRDMNNSPLVVDGVVVLNDNIKVSDPGGFRYEIGDGLVGLDARDGRRLWQVFDCADGRANQPTVWRTGGRAYVLTADGGGLRCIDPRDGRVLWHVAGPQNEMGWLAVAGDVLLAHGRPAGKDDQTTVQGWKLRLDGASKLWEVPVAQGGARGGFAVHRGAAYWVSSNAKKVICADPQTGQTLAEAPQDSGLNGEHDNAFVAGMGDWLLTSNGREHDAFRVYRTDGKSLTALGLFDQPVTGGYCAAVQPALADGRIWVRLQNRVACFDVRAK